MLNIVWNSALLLAVKGGHTGTAEMLLERGADLTAKNKVSMMPMLM